MACRQAKFKQLYDQFVNSSFFGGLALDFLQPQDADTRAQQITTGYVVNKDPSDLLGRQIPNSHFHFEVFDHLRVVEEVLSGIFKSDNKEFNLILRPFLKEFMFGNIYLLYSEEFREYELTLAASLSLENEEDPYERLEKACPNSRFRLLRRVANDGGGWRWDAVLTGLQDVKVEEFLPVIDGEKKSPIRLSFNEGFFFVRLFHIFSQYEAQMQTYKALFNAIHKVGDIYGEDIKAINLKKEQMNTPQVFTHTVTTQVETTTTIENLELIDRMKNLTESYDNIHALLNDSLGRLGLAGDDSTKAERITTGENFRALQPNMSFQEAILTSLDNVTERINIHFKQTVNFRAPLTPNQQGIPVVGDGQNKKPRGMPKTPKE